MIQATTSAEIIAAKELLAEYDAECANPLIGETNPQASLYADLERNGVLRCFGAYDAGQLVGFVTVLSTIYPHYGKKVATVESLFARKYGAELLDAAEQYARESQCVAIFYSAPAGGRLERLLSGKKSCKRTNAIFCRSLR